MTEETITPVSPPGPLVGRLIYAGDLTVNGEEISGVALEISRAELIGKKLPMYRKCVIAEENHENTTP